MIASLKRLDPAAPVEGAFWKLFVTLPEKTQFLGGRDRAQFGWALIAKGIAIMAPKAHDGMVSVGTALAREGYSELRLSRFLDTPTEGIGDEVIGIARFMAARAAPFRWHDLARIVLFAADDDHGKHVRVRVARDYYRTLHALKK
ncbi:MAG: type I-E CRISPR-associated protein Cse2/CasB [Alphaproteobacteria bacterium]|nr:type I-E CRISPR-associated protein Cse2/CasB [Alphaproteobacteria bacterium]